MSQDNPESLEIYTDGSALGNPGRGGYAFLVLDKKDSSIKEFGGFADFATNNQMELTALLEALIFASKIKTPRNINIHLDSDYVRNGITLWIHNWKKNNWKTAGKKDVLNKELWQKIDQAMIDAEKIHNIKLFCFI